MAANDPRSLSPEYSIWYINDEGGFRAIIDREGGFPVRFNLGEKFESYMTDPDFRGRVLAVVGENRGLE